MATMTAAEFITELTTKEFLEAWRTAYGWRVAGRAEMCALLRLTATTYGKLIRRLKFLRDLHGYDEAISHLTSLVPGGDDNEIRELHRTVALGRISTTERALSAMVAMVEALAPLSEVHEEAASQRSAILQESYARLAQGQPSVFEYAVQDSKPSVIWRHARTLKFNGRQRVYLLDEQGNMVSQLADCVIVETGPQPNPLNLGRMLMSTDPEAARALGIEPPKDGAEGPSGDPYDLEASAKAVGLDP